MQMSMYSEIHKANVSLVREFQKHLYNVSRKNGAIDHDKYRKWASKWKWIE